MSRGRPPSAARSRPESMPRARLVGLVVLALLILLVMLYMPTPEAAGILP